MPTVSDRQNGKQFIPWLGLLIQEQSDFCLYCLPRPVCPIAEGHYTNILFGLAAPLFSETIYFHAYYILLIDAPGRGSIFGYHAILILIKALPFINKCPLSYFFTFFFFWERWLNSIKISALYLKITEWMGLVNCFCCGEFWLYSYTDQYMCSQFWLNMGEICSLDREIWHEYNFRKQKENESCLAKYNEFLALPMFWPRS